VDRGEGVVTRILFGLVANPACERVLQMSLDFSGFLENKEQLI